MKQDLHQEKTLITVLIPDENNHKHKIKSGNHKYFHNQDLNKIINSFYISIQSVLDWFPKSWNIYSDIYYFAGDGYSMAKYLKNYNKTLENVQRLDSDIINQYLFSGFIGNLEDRIFLYVGKAYSEEWLVSKSIINIFISKIYSLKASVILKPNNNNQTKIIQYLENKFLSFKYEIEGNTIENWNNVNLIQRWRANETTTSNDNLNLYDIWMVGIQEDIRKRNYKSVFDFLEENSFTKKENGELKWNYYIGNAKNRVYAAFLKECDNKGYINLNDYSPEMLRDICENTFNDQIKSFNAFQPNSIKTLRDIYFEEFQLMPNIKLHRSYR